MKISYDSNLLAVVVLSCCRAVVSEACLGDARPHPCHPDVDCGAPRVGSPGGPLVPAFLSSPATQQQLVSNTHQLHAYPVGKHPSTHRIHHGHHRRRQAQELRRYDPAAGRPQRARNAARHTNLANSWAGSGLRIGIVHARWNAEIIGALLDGTKKALKAAGVKDENIVTQSVPGSYELPYAVKQCVYALRGEGEGRRAVLTQTPQALLCVAD